MLSFQTVETVAARYLDECVPALKDPKRERNRVRALMRRPMASRIIATIRSADIADFVRESYRLLSSSVNIWRPCSYCPLASPART